MADGVTGNTSVFGTEESRFEPWWDNIKRLNLLLFSKIARGFFVLSLSKV